MALIRFGWASKCSSLIIVFLKSIRKQVVNEACYFALVLAYKFFSPKQYPLEEYQHAISISVHGL